MVMDEIIGAILQIGFFTLIPFIVFLIRNRSTRGFFKYIGLTPCSRKSIYLAIICSLVILTTALGPVWAGGSFREALFDPQSVTGKIRQMGLGTESILVLMIMALFKTSLSEEILFRGFIAKRLINSLGFVKGNLIQAAIFAIIHLVLFLALIQASFVFLIYIFLLSGIAAYLIGWINEKKGKGSIIPGWIAHGLGNILSYFIIAFVI